MGYEHGDTPEPEVIVTTPAESATNENDVAIAVAEADASVAREKIYAQERDAERDQEIARLRGQLDGMRNALAVLAPPEPEPEPEPEPAAVVVADEVGEPAPPEDTPEPKEPKPKKKAGFWDAYR